MSRTTIWVFHGVDAKFSSGVFESKEIAEKNISKYKLSGILTEYPLNMLVYDWSIENGYFDIKNESQTTTEFIQKFSSAYQNHEHYENGELDS